MRTYANKTIRHFFSNTLYLYSHPMDPPHLQVFLTKVGVWYFPIRQVRKTRNLPSNKRRYARFSKIELREVWNEMGVCLEKEGRGGRCNSYVLVEEWGEWHDIWANKMGREKGKETRCLSLFMSLCQFRYSNIFDTRMFRVYRKNCVFFLEFSKFCHWAEDDPVKFIWVRRVCQGESVWLR